jgi:hypothetical protein
MSIWTTLRVMWTRLNLNPVLSTLSDDAQADLMGGGIMKLILGFYRTGFEPTAIARALIAHAICFIVDCGGPGVDTAAFDRAMCEMEELLLSERARRTMSPPSDYISKILRRE